MYRWASLACAGVLTLFGMGVAHATTHVQLLDTWPAGDDVTLGTGQNFYLHLRYTSDVPVHIWVQPTFQGKPVKAGTNTSRAYPAGTGEVLGWFFLFDPGTQVDAVRIDAGDGSVDRTPAVATFAVSVRGGNQPAAQATGPAWLTSLAATNRAAERAADAQRMNTPTSAADIALFNGFMLAMLALGLVGIGGPAWGVWRWRGAWCIAAAVPAAVMAFVVLRIVVDGMRDPTSHNLWPFEIVMWGGASCAWMLVAALAHVLSGAGRRA